jgi:PKHD-type hydroxylase
MPAQSLYEDLSEFARVTLLREARDEIRQNLGTQYIIQLEQHDSRAQRARSVTNLSSAVAPGNPLMVPSPASMPALLNQVLTADELQHVTSTLSQAGFVDGRATSTLAGKNNLQLPTDAPEARAAAALVLERLNAHPLFEAAVHPRFVLSPLISKYDPGHEYPDHVDVAIMNGCRADVAVTVFLSDKATYEGGDLVIDTGNGERSYRLEAGSAIAYPASTLHRVAPVTHGTRLAAVTWVQSWVREDAHRTVLCDLRTTLDSLEESNLGSDRLRRSYWNLLRMWAE